MRYGDIPDDLGIDGNARGIMSYDAEVIQILILKSPRRLEIQVRQENIFLEIL